MARSEPSAVVRAFVAQLKRHLRDPTKFVLLDSSTASLARAMIGMDISGSVASISPEICGRDLPRPRLTLVRV